MSKSISNSYREPGMNQYYYWLIPDEPHRTKLQHIIHRFSKVYQSPVFTPHITVGTGTSIPVVTGLSAPNVQLTGVHSEHTYFRSLYFKCASSQDILSAWEFFGGKEPFVPHLSLIYGDFSQARERDWCSNTPLYEHPISCSSIWIIQGDRQVKNWKKVESFSLKTHSI